MPVPQNPFAKAAVHAVAELVGLPPEDFMATAPPRAELGDFAVGLFPAAKAKKGAPPALAQKVAAEFQPNALLASATATGPFVNFRANRRAAFRQLFAAAAARSEPGTSPLLPADLGTGQTVCIDFGSPNIAKHLAYHHIRSTVIGSSLTRLYRAVGYRVVGINHLGDWGTTFGMLIAATKAWGVPEPLDITALNELYVRFRAAMATDSSLEESGRSWFKKLEQGDADARDLWKRFREVSLAEFQIVFDKLGVRFDEIRGESEYEPELKNVIELYKSKGLAVESEGALVVDVGEPPLLLEKSDGATTYHTRDIAAAMYRWNTYHFARSLYVVDRGQGLHFKQLFKALELAGFDWSSRCRHIPFGLVRLGGKKTGTRTGNVVLLKEVLAEATERAKATIREKNPDLSETDAEVIAPLVGIGAVVFANLFASRENDVDFEWEQILNTQGDSGPYVQYGHARCAGILRKAGALPSSEPDAEKLAHDVEWSVAKRLLDFGDIVARAADTNDPHHLTRYLIEVCGDFSRWYTLGNGDPSLRVLCEDEATKAARARLVSAVKHVLATGLHLLGVGAPETM